MAGKAPTDVIADQRGLLDRGGLRHQRNGGVQVECKAEGDRGLVKRVECRGQVLLAAGQVGLGAQAVGIQARAGIDTGGGEAKEFFALG